MSGHQCHLARVGTGQHDDGIAQLLLKAVHRITQGLGIESFQADRQHLDPANVLRLVRKVAGGARGSLGFQGFQFAFQLLLPVQQRTQLVAQLASW